MQQARGEITLLLARWKGGEPSAFQELMPLVYPHLREVAAAYIRRERNPDVLQATALVHELYLRLLNQKCRQGIRIGPALRPGSKDSSQIPRHRALQERRPMIRVAQVHREVMPNPVLQHPHLPRP